jgi:hypothetical protein
LFLVVIVIAIIIGCILKGNPKNIDPSEIKAIYLVFVSFLIEAIMITLIRKGYLVRGTVTYIVNLIMYIVLFLFIYKNRYNKWLLLMGTGFLLNALAIFFNGGAMPVSSNIINQLGMTQNVSAEGLYVIINANTRLAFLGDIIPLKYPRSYAVSIGDIVEVIAIAAFIITEMKSKKYKSNLIA